MSNLYHLSALILFGPAYLVHAQVERASILGNATDNSAAAVPNVVVTVTNAATNTSVRVVTDSAGAFTVLNLIPGTYSVSAMLAGFNPVTYRGVELQVGQHARLDLHMQVGDLKQTVEVAASATMLQTENAAVGQVINNTAVSTRPLNGRNFVQLAILAPGVIREYLDHSNEHPKPFVWTAHADLILGKIQRLCERISNSPGVPSSPKSAPKNSSANL
jgi:hypothetical protein